MQVDSVLRDAKKYGYVTALVLFATSISQAVIIFIFPSEQSLLIFVLSSSSLILTYTYRRMFLGVVAIAEEYGSKEFISTAANYMQGTICTGLVFAADGPIRLFLLDDNFSSLLYSVFVLATIVYLGVLDIRISKHFGNLQTSYGETAKRVAFWKKVAGYLLASVFLSFIGIFIALISDYYMWRLIGKRLKKSE